MLEVHQFPCLSDNYGYLLHNSVTNETAAIDTPDAGEYLDQAKAKGWTITHIWNTHWHPDHVGGNTAVLEALGAELVIPAGEQGRIAGGGLPLSAGDRIKVGDDIHRVEADQPIGVVAYGFDRDVSYGYMAGLNLQKLTAE